jgi:hypothetical protein
MVKKEGENRLILREGRMISALFRLRHENRITLLSVAVFVVSSSRFGSLVVCIQLFVRMAFE